MQTIGTTLQQIRRGQGLTQKELYGGLISASFAGRLERGQHDLTAEKLFAILDRLQVTPTEFRFIQRGYQPTQEETIQADLTTAYQQKNFPWMRHIETRYRDSKQSAQRLLAAQADITIKLWDGTTLALTPNMAQLWDDLNAADTWTLYQIRSSATWLAVTWFNRRSDLIASGVQKLHAACARYLTDTTDPFHVLDIQVEFDMDALQGLLTTGQFTAARQFRENTALTHPDRLSLDGRLAYQATACIWEWYFGDWHRAEDLARELATVAHFSHETTITAILKAYRQHARSYHQRHDKQGDA